MPSLRDLDELEFNFNFNAKDAISMILTMLYICVTFLYYALAGVGTLEIFLDNSYTSSWIVFTIVYIVSIVIVYSDINMSETKTKEELVEELGFEDKVK